MYNKKAIEHTLFHSCTLSLKFLFENAGNKSYTWKSKWIYSYLHKHTPQSSHLS